MTRTIFGKDKHPGRVTVFLLGLAAAVFVLSLLALAGRVGPAEAAFPGKNGKIAFVSNRDAGAGEIYTIGPNGGAATRITFPNGGSASPAYSPDGTKIAFMKGNHIFVMPANGLNTDGTGATQITPPGTINKEPTWSPDGTKIAYVVQQADYEIYVANADGTGTPQRLTDNSFPDTQPAWSPLGNQVAFVTARTDGPVKDTDRNIYVMDADPATNDAALNLTPNTSNPVYQLHDDDPSWSPNGEWIAYSNGMNGGDIWRIKPDGTGKERLTQTGVNASPAWSPDGTKIAFVATPSGTNRDIWVMDADGTDSKVLHANAANDINPDWQQDSIPPNTTITSGPASFSRAASAAFSFDSSEKGSSFECSLDGAPFSACDSEKTYSGLADGSHTFQVRATDAAENVDPTPAAHTWRVDTQKPSGTIVINGGRASTGSRTVTLALSASDPDPASGVSHMRFRNENTTTWSAWQAYATKKSWALSAGAGTKRVYVQYKDRANNASAAASDSIVYRP